MVCACYIYIDVSVCVCAKSLAQHISQMKYNNNKGKMKKKKHIHAKHGEQQQQHQQNSAKSETKYEEGIPGQYLYEYISSVASFLSFTDTLARELAYVRCAAPLMLLPSLPPCIESTNIFSTLIEHIDLWRLWWWRRAKIIFVFNTISQIWCSEPSTSTWQDALLMPSISNWTRARVRKAF